MSKSLVTNFFEKRPKISEKRERVRRLATLRRDQSAICCDEWETDAEFLVVINILCEYYDSTLSENLTHPYVNTGIPHQPSVMVHGCLESRQSQLLVLCLSQCKISSADLGFLRGHRGDQEICVKITCKPTLAKEMICEATTSSQRQVEYWGDCRGLQ